MDTDEIPLDDKARRMRDLLVSFYSPISSTSSNPFSKHDYLTKRNRTMLGLISSSPCSQRESYLLSSCRVSPPRFSFD
ncbi:hypothetical protein JHK86_006697 [Glycine max]|nr:hypothetical protein JHK86_006697 [Glycine max]